MAGFTTASQPNGATRRSDKPPRHRVSGRMGSALYHPPDPEAKARDYDDKHFTLDHFQTKLLHLAAGFQTRTGSRLAQIRHARLKRFMEEFMEEIGLPSEP